MFDNRANKWRRVALSRTYVKCKRMSSRKRDTFIFFSPRT